MIKIHWTPEKVEELKEYLDNIVTAYDMPEYKGVEINGKLIRKDPDTYSIVCALADIIDIVKPIQIENETE